MMVMTVTILTIIILGAGFYLWRKPLSRAARTAVAGVTVAACAVVWLVTFSQNASMKVSGTDDSSQSQSRSQKTIDGPAGGTTAPAAPAAQDAPGKPTAQKDVAKTTPSGARHGQAPASNPSITTDETTDETTDLDPIVAKVDEDQLEALIGDAVAIKPEGSTMVDTIVKKGTTQAAAPDTPSQDDYSFPEVIQGPDGMVMIIPDEPLPSVSSRRQLATGEDEIPAPGEVVALTYDMFSWSTGQMVESSQTILNGPLMYRLGGKDTPIGIPKYLDDAINNRPYGSTVQVVFEKEMHDLPVYMDRHDGYVLVVRVDKPDMDGETALAHMENAINR